MPLGESSHHRSPPAVALLFLLTLLALLPTLGGWFPARELARTLSTDGRLSEHLDQLLVASQGYLAGVLALTTLVVGLVPGLLHRLARGALALSTRRFAFAVGLLSFMAVLALQSLLFQGIPHVTDAISHLFQARIFASGRLYAPVPPCPEHFFADNVFMGLDGKWHTKYFPGQALWLTLGTGTGAPWLPMPLAACLATLSFAALTERLLERPSARLASVLFALSPLNLLLGASFMSHTTFMAFALGGLALWVWHASKPLAERALPLSLAGACLGFAAITRPQDAVLVAATVGLAFPLLRLPLVSVVRRHALLLAGGVLLPLLLLLLWNGLVYGAPLATGYNFEGSPSITPIKSDSFGFSPSYPPAQAAAYTAWTFLRFNKALLGWPSSLLFIPFALLARHHFRCSLWLLAASLLCVAFYALFPYYAFEYEARYWHPVVPLALVLTATGAAGLYRGLHRSRFGAPFAFSVVAGLLLAGSLHAVVYYWPRYIWPAYSDAYEQASPDIERRAREENLAPALVLITATGRDDFRYSSGFVFNDPDLERDIIYARDLGPDGDCLEEHFPDRPRYRYVPEPNWSNGRFVPLD